VGGKGGVSVDPKQRSQKELEGLSRRYFTEISVLIGPERDIPAPDVNTTPQIMAWIMDEYSQIHGSYQPAVITGKPVAAGGSRGRDIATAQGGFYILAEALQKIKVKGKKVAVQGFGNAGANMAEILSANGFSVVAVSDSKGGIYNAKGLDIAKLLKHKEKSGSVLNFQGSKNIKGDILEQETDILVLAALENAVTADNAQKIKATLLLELANGPITPDADEILAVDGVEVIPDVLANAGGVAVSYFEQVQDAYLYFWKESEVLEKLKELMSLAFNDVWERRKKYNCDLRMGAYVLAVERVAQAMKDRGRG